ncbi:hypothetical protein BHM03_00031662 [Ensete ventricosum]|nr:hypothetical protein BHM03_00031662 [Ensete ventricosum]
MLQPCGSASRPLTSPSSRTPSPPTSPPEAPSPAPPISRPLRFSPSVASPLLTSHCLSREVRIRWKTGSPGHPVTRLFFASRLSQMDGRDAS